MKKLYVLVGGPGTGKSAIIKKLYDKGFYVIEEIARYLKEGELRKDIPYNEKILPETNRDAFQRKVLETHLNWLKEVPEIIKTKGETKIIKEIFSDTGIIEIIAYYEIANLKAPEKLLEEAEKIKYDRVFLVEPPSDYRRDEVRTETKEGSLWLHNRIYELYKSYNHDIVRVPSFCENKEEDIEKRVEFILSEIGKV